MTDTKHTPGPWAAVANWGGVHVVTHRDDDDPATWSPEESGAIIASYIGDHTERRTSGNELANAKLIAAAPDLLADLREAVATLRRYEALHRAKGTDDSTAKAEVNAALAARFEATIAKATE